jgi:O-antigen ligase
MSIFSLRQYLTTPVILWLALWVSINSGPWNIRAIYDGGFDTINGIRATLPFFVLAIGILHFLIVNGNRFSQPTLPEKLFWIYGFSMLAAGLEIDRWFNYNYWGFAFVATLACARLFINSGDPLKQVILLNRVTWMAAVGILLILVVVARDMLFITSDAGVSGYGVINRVSDIGGMAMSRSSGMARFAAIPAILAFAMFWRSKEFFSKIIAVIVFIASVGLVWFMQSRGAIFSLAAALGFMMLFMGPRIRFAGIIVLILGIVMGSGVFSDVTKNYVYNHLERGQGSEWLEKMSGRDRIWRKAWRAIEEQPLLGYGPEADRRVFHENAQNALIYAWLCGGIIGAIGYIGGVLVTWVLYFKILYRHRFRLTYEQRDMLIMTGAILAFFTIRSYPENTAAFYSVDLLVQLPAMLYIGVLHWVLNKREYLS